MTVVAASTLLAGTTVAANQTFTVVIDPDTALEEIVDISNYSSGNTFTITRSVDATGTAQDHSAGAIVRHMIIGRDLRESNTHIESSIGVHGLGSTSSVVGTLDTQTLSAKTLTTPTINGATITGSVTSTATITGGTITGAVVTGLSSSGLGSTDATPKSYVDSILGSATAASSSATAAASSALAAATSAASASTSASSSLTSANSSSTSAASSLASQNAASTSASSASASQSAASTSAASASVSATAAASSALAASTSATSAAASATTAANSVATITTSANSAANSATAAASSATAAASSATAAAASTSAAATSATSAANSATAAATSATSAANSATAAATSATSAATQATAAATSANSAATSATSASNSATAAATSASSAATSASSSLTTYNTYKTYYLGSFSSAPTVDNQGNALITGATYFNSTTSLMYAWSGSAWQAISTTASYSAPTLGSQTIASGTTYTNINDLTINSTTVPTSKTLVDTDSSQTLTNKTLTGAVASADPTVALGLATKQYVDVIAAGVNYHPPVKAASVTNLGVTYNNGTSGVGATLTADTNRAFNTLDGQSVSVGERVLIKDQTTQTQNGIYSLTTNGSTSAPWVLTRTTDQDNSIAGEMANGDVIFATGGTVNSGKTFVNSTVGAITIGTTNITYAAYYAGLPAQAGNSGNYLTTDGTTPSWGAITTLAGPTLTGTVIVSGDIDMTATGGPGSIKDELTLLLMGAL